MKLLQKCTAALVCKNTVIFLVSEQASRLVSQLLGSSFTDCTNDCLTWVFWGATL